MSRHSSGSSYYQPSSRPESPAQLSTASSSQHRQHSPTPPQQPPPPPRNQKADQILQNFYVKVIQIVVLARVTHTDPHAGLAPRRGTLRGAPLLKKTSKWFNLELEDLDIYKEDAKFWRALAITDSPPTMLVELLLDTSELSPSQMLVLMDENNRKSRVDISSHSSSSTTPLGQARTRRSIILESWSLTLSNTPPDRIPEPPVVYKKSIIFFRSLFAYMRLLPAYQLYRRLRKQNHPLKIGFRVNRGQSPEESMFRDSEIGIEVPLIEGETRAMLSEYRFGQVETPLGAFSLKVTYRSNCEFHVDESEAVLSSRFIDMDENYFTPTIVTHSQESGRSSRRPSIDGNTARRPPSGAAMARRPSNASTDMYNSGNYPDHYSTVPTLRPRRNSAQSLQQRSGDYSSSQSSVSSLGTRMSRRGSSGAPGSQFTPLDQQNPAGTPPFSVTHGGHAAVAKHYVDPIMESPPFKLGTSQSDKDNRRPLSSNFSPFKSPSLSSSPSPSFLEALPSSLSSRPSSVHLNRSPSSSSMSRVQSSQLGSGLLGSVPKTGGALATNIAGAASSSGAQSTGANLLSTSVKSNASSTSAPRVTSSFGHRQDSSGRRASSESLPPGRGSRNSIVGASSLFQLTPDEDDVNAFVRMLDTPEPLKMFGKASGSGIGAASFGTGDHSGHLSASALKTKATLDRFQQLKQVNADLSESMSASQILSREQQQQQQQQQQHQRQAGHHPPLTVTTTSSASSSSLSGNAQRRSNLSDLEPSSPTGFPFAPSLNRHSQSLSHQPGTPSPLHSEIPVYPPTSSGHRSGRQIGGHSATGSMSNKRQSWLIGGDGVGHISSSGGSSSIGRAGSNMGSIAFRHGSLDQGKDILGMEEALGRLRVSGPQDDMAFGSFPEDVHHQHSLYSAPLDTGKTSLGGATTTTTTSSSNATYGPDPRPIPSLTSGDASSSRPGRLLRLGSGSSGASFTLPRLRPRAAEDNESLNEMNSAEDNATGHLRTRRSHRDHHHHHHRDDEEEDDEVHEDEDEEDARDGHRGGGGPRSNNNNKHDGHNTSLNDDDDMLFIMSELSLASNSGEDSTDRGVAAAATASASAAASALGGTGGELSDRVMLSLTGAMLNPRSQSQSPALGPLGNGGSSTGASSSTSSSPHLRLFGRNAGIGAHSGMNLPLGTSNGGSSSGHVGSTHSRGSSSSNHSQTHSVISHSRGGSNGENIHQSVDILPGMMLRRRTQRK
ncbi:autophagy protein 13 [Mortierella alpina]|uniref:Autophagy-related protein 13 n=1 Tax=Mortierella alpina TaxID=64518 RepID=A0A9P6IYY5_MORAP|nr:autophagy protein 13 [Mortierella alpina]